MNRIMYTAQTQIVIDTLNEHGVYYVKKSYIKKKYQESAGIMLQAYNFMIKHMKNKPKLAEYPVWLFDDVRYAGVHEDQIILKLSIPEEALTFFDNTAWEKILSMEYIAENDQDEKNYQKMLMNCNIDCGYTAFEKPYYPMVKRHIEKSWTRVFKIDNSSNIRAASWCIKKEWIID